MAGYVANAVEQTFLLPKDMADLRFMRKHEVFLGLKRDLAMVSFLLPFFFFFLTSFPSQAIQVSFRAEEMVNSSHCMYKEEEGRRIAAMEAFQVAEKSNHDLKAKLIEAEKEKKSATTALDNVEKQAEGQWVLLHNAEDQLAASKEQIITLKKRLKKVEKAKDQADKAREEAEKAREEAKQQGYDIGVVETEEALKAKVFGVCRTYCAQV